MNLFRLPERLPSEELTQSLYQGTNTRIERIVSTGQCSPPDFWYDQDENEWVMLLQGEAVLTVEEEIVQLKAGDSLLLLKHQRHRIEQTSTNPPCIWICVFETT